MSAYSVQIGAAGIAEGLYHKMGTELLALSEQNDQDNGSYFSVDYKGKKQTNGLMFLRGNCQDRDGFLPGCIRHEHGRSVTEKPFGIFIYIVHIARRTNSSSMSPFALFPIELSNLF